MSNIVTFERVAKFYMPPPEHGPVFWELNLTFPKNRIIGLLGENGAGKTTLLKMIANLTTPVIGMVRINGEPVSRKTRQWVSFMPQPQHLMGLAAVKHTITYFRDFFPDFNMDKALALCVDFGLQLNDTIARLSVGNQVRLCLLLTLSRRVPLYLLDDPFAMFDPVMKRQLVQTMLSMVEEGQTIIIATHMLRDLDGVLDEIVILHENGVITANTDEIRQQGKSIETFYMEVKSRENADDDS